MNMSEKQETEEDHSLKTQKNIIDYIDDDNNKKMPLEVICI
jgi:hypothetical protein